MSVKYSVEKRRHECNAAFSTTDVKYAQHITPTDCVMLSMTFTVCSSDEQRLYAMADQCLRCSEATLAQAAKMPTYRTWFNCSIPGNAL